MDENFFDEIDTKAKAYWLGFIYADGSVYINKKNGYKQMEIAVKIDDEQIIDSFIHIIQPSTRKFIKTKQYMRAVIRINSQKICNDLIKHSCVMRKSMIIELPVLVSRKLYLAFLLGFFDGDGKQKTTK